MPEVNVTQAEDGRFMAEALQLARRGEQTVTPNPMVGAVLVKAGEVIGRGWHEKAGGAHAEINALNAAKEAGFDTAGSTLYVTLEPCSHTGRTPPCCEAIQAAGVGRVVAAMKDPNPDVAGSGLAYLERQGISVASGLMDGVAETLNRGFISRMERGKPFVTAKTATSLDGRTAMASGESQWVTGEAARREVHAMRARSCAVLTGIDTVLADDPVMTAREDMLGTAALRQPQLVILDSCLRTPANATLFDDKLSAQREIVIVYALQEQADASLEQRRQALDARGAHTIALPAADDGRVDLVELLKVLADRQLNTVMLESGPTLAAALLQQRLVDEIVSFVAPKLMGASARPMFDLPLQRMQESIGLAVDDIRAYGNDWCVIARPEWND